MSKPEPSVGGLVLNLILWLVSWLLILHIAMGGPIYFRVDGVVYTIQIGKLPDWNGLF